jgi:hypothetical protein
MDVAPFSLCWEMNTHNTLEPEKRPNSKQCQRKRQMSNHEDYTSREVQAKCVSDFSPVGTAQEVSEGVAHRILIFPLCLAVLGFGVHFLL